jgi:type IV pilus assembly protein PilM
VLVAARREMVERLLAAGRRAGLRVEGVDLSAFAMIRALQHRGVKPDEDGVALFVHVGGLTNLAIADGGRCLFTRVAPTGIEMMAAQLAERRGLTIEHARQWLRHVALESPAEDVEGDPEIVVEARGVLVEGVRRVADDVRNSIDFFAAQSDGRQVLRTVLTGPALGITGFSQQLSGDLGLPVEPGMLAESRPGVLNANDSGSFTIAAGLAVEALS